MLFFFLCICHTLAPSPSAGRGCGLKGSTHLSPVHALHFGLADWVSTPAPRQLSTNTQLTTLFTHALTLSTMGIRLRRRNPTHLESNPRLSHPKGNSGTPTPPGRGGDGTKQRLFSSSMRGGTEYDSATPTAVTRQRLRRLRPGTMDCVSHVCSACSAPRKLGRVRPGDWFPFVTHHGAA